MPDYGIFVKTLSRPTYIRDKKVTQFGALGTEALMVLLVVGLLVSEGKGTSIEVRDLATGLPVWRVTDEVRD